MDRYDREERSYDRGGRDRPEGGSSGSLGDFPWQDSEAGDRPSEVWEEPPQTSGRDRSPGGRSDGQGNPLAIAGFVCSLVMWIPIPVLPIVLWILAVVFSSIGLSRSKKRGLPHRGLAIAGLCISMIGVVIFIVFAALFAGGAIEVPG